MNGRRWLGVNISLVITALVTPYLAADEGMWPLNRFPTVRVQQPYGFAPTAQWLQRAQLASVRFADGCSGSVVSPTGLVMTNYHCVVECVERLSTKDRNLEVAGFYAASPAGEQRCPGMELNQLTRITDVTDRVTAAVAGAEGERFAKARQAVFATIERECATSNDVRCEVTTLYRGGKYDLYTYRRFQDVRLVFAPEFDTAFFGGDPDNFMFPRFDLDVAFVRLYDRDAPFRATERFTWSPSGASEGDLLFVAGHPATTLRQYTPAQLEFERDVRLPTHLLFYSERRGLLTEFQRRGAEQARVAGAQLVFLENTLKVLRGEFAALTEPALLERKRAEEAALRRHVAVQPQLQERVSGAWDAVAAAVRRKRDPWLRSTALSRLTGSEMVAQALTLVRLAAEERKPNEQRLPEFTDAALPPRRQRIEASTPFNRDLEVVLLAHILTHIREQLGLDDPAVKTLLGRKSPDEVARDAIGGSRLDHSAARIALMKGGDTAVQASMDPLIRLARAIDPFARDARRQIEEDTDAIIDRNQQLIAEARFAVEGDRVYPDATFTLRATFGTVKGWNEGGRDVPPFTTLGGLYERETGSSPFALPKRWHTRKPFVTLNTPFNLSADTDIVGGNSGSPMIDRKGRIVGLVFDGNIPSIGGEYWFDPAKNRTVAVDSRGIREALKSVYQADRILQEIDGR
jgi:V8-like Glu-specific endopeptidase